MKRFLARFTNLCLIWLVGATIVAFVHPPAMMWFSGHRIVSALGSEISA
jgi:hypothetical protein